MQQGKKYWCSADTKEEMANETPQQQIILLGDGGGGNNNSNAPVETIDNSIMFYGNVDGPNAKLFNKAVRTLDTDLQMFGVRYRATPPPIRVHISSDGGSLLDGFSMMDTIVNSVTPVHTYIDGHAASAATLISVVADKRFMFKNSRLLIHQLSSAVWGKFEDIVEEVENLDSFMKQIKKIYKDHTKISAKDLNEILKKDRWFSAEECLKMGIIDEII